MLCIATKNIFRNQFPPCSAHEVHLLCGEMKISQPGSFENTAKWIKSTQTLNGRECHFRILEPFAFTFFRWILQTRA